MNILFIARATLYSNPGGDTVQITNTATCLKDLGVAVDICLTDDPIEYKKYDLIHFFNIIRPADIIVHIKRSGKPYVISTIFVEYAETQKHALTGLRKFLFSLFSPDTMEYIKVLARFVANREKVQSRYYLLHGHRRSVQKVIAGAQLLLPNSVSEYERLVKRYQTEPQSPLAGDSAETYKTRQRYKVIPNGIDARLFSLDGENEKEEDLVICVARVEPLKNQLNLIRALNGSNLRLLIIGAPAVNQKKYYEQCKREAAENIQFIDPVPQKELVSYYRKAKVHVLPSWFETTGLSSLEAAAMGCNIVITDKGDTKEYFKEYAYYCDPKLPASIFVSIRQAAKEPVNKALAKMILEHYTWQIAAMKTQEAYKEILTS